MPNGRDQNRVVVGWLAAAGLFYLTFLIIRPFLAPLGWATVIAIVSRPLYARLLRRFSPSRAALITTVLVAIIVIAPLSIIATAFVNEALEAFRDFQEALANGRLDWIERVSRRVMEALPVMPNGSDLGTALLQATQRAALALAAFSGSILRNLVTFVFKLVLALFASFFLLRDSEYLVWIVRATLPLEADTREHLIAQTADLITVSVGSAVLVAGLQGLLGGLVFAAVGIEAPVFWGVVMAWLCLLPLGAWVVWLPAAILLAISGQYGRALIVAGLGFGIVSAIDNFLRPMLLSGSTSMNGLLVFVSLLGGMAAFGALGLVLGPVILAIAVAVLTVYAESQRQSGTPERTS